MKKNVLNEINQMKFLFGYKPGKVLSEQNSVEEINMYEDSDFMDFEDIEMMPSPDVAEPDVKPDVKPGIDRPRTRPSRPNYDPAHIPVPDPDTHPQGYDEDEVSYELELDDMPSPRRMRNTDMSSPRRMRDMSRSRMNDFDMTENVYEIEIDSDISELFN